MRKKSLIGLVLSAIFFFNVSFVNANVVINEFLPNSVNIDYEWIEIYNDDSTSVDISGYNISENGASKNFTIKDVVLEPKSFLVLVRSDEVFNQTYDVGGSKIIEYGDVAPSLNLNDGGDSIFLYDSNGLLVDSVNDYANPGENVSLGKPEESGSEIVKLLSQTPGAKNDNSNPAVEWVYPKNNTYVSYLVNIVVRITDDTSTIEFVMVNFNGTNYSMSKNNNEWSYLWDTSLNLAKSYGITIFFKDSNSKYYSDNIFNIVVNNTEVLNQLNKAPVVTAVNLTSTDHLKRANGSLRLSWAYKDDDNDAITDKEIMWYIDELEQTTLKNFTSMPSTKNVKNQTWVASVRIFDGKNWSLFYNSTSIKIENSGPVQSVPYITSSDSKNRKNGTLTCNGDVFDWDKDNASSLVRWYKNGILVLAAAGSSALKHGNYSKNDNIICERVPNDGFINGSSVNSTDFMVMNSAPVLVSNIEDKVWAQGTTILINLISSFMDLDGDQLTYTFLPIDNITVSIDSNKKIATLSPDKGFVGTRSLKFTASDGTEGVESNEIILTVNPASGENEGIGLTVEEKAESQETLADDSIENPDAGPETNESIVITGQVIKPEDGGKKNKINYMYFIIPILIVAAAGIYFFRKRMPKKEDYL